MLSPGLSNAAVAGILLMLGLATAGAVAVWRGSLLRDYLTKDLRTGMLPRMRMGTVGAIWFMLAMDSMVGGEAVLRLFGVGRDAEIAAEPYLGTPMLAFAALWYGSITGWPRWTWPHWFREEVSKPGNSIMG